MAPSNSCDLFNTVDGRVVLCIDIVVKKMMLKNRIDLRSAVWVVLGSGNVYPGNADEGFNGGLQLIAIFCGS